MVVDDVLEQLLRQAYLFDDPRAYEAGVRDALAAVDEHVRDAPVSTPVSAVDGPLGHRAA
jgi:hypothetical protein